VDELQTMKFWTDRVTADAEVRKYVRYTGFPDIHTLADVEFSKVDRFAARTREDWKREILRQ
jgi:hypothetical protein